MACEKNQNCTSCAAAASGDIGQESSKVANFIGRVTGVSFVVHKIRKAYKKVQERKAAAREATRQRQAEAARRKVEYIKDPQRRRAAANLQTLIGAQVRKGDIENLFELDQSKSLSGQTRSVSGDYGVMIYDDEPNGAITIQAISPPLGREIALNNQLTAYVPAAKAGQAESDSTPQAAASVSLPQDKTAKAKGWLKDNQAEIVHVANNYVVPLALGLARGDNYIRMGGRALYVGSGPEPQDPFEEWLYGARMERVRTVRKYERMGRVSAQLHNDLQTIRRQKQMESQRNRELVERIKEPGRKQAAMALQTKRVIGKRTSMQNLAGLMGDHTAKAISGHTYEIESRLGRVYFDDLGNGQVSVQGVKPELGRELQLLNGLSAILR